MRPPNAKDPSKHALIDLLVRKLVVPELVERQRLKAQAHEQVRLTGSGLPGGHRQGQKTKPPSKPIGGPANYWWQSDWRS